MSNKKNHCRENTLHALAVEIDKAVRVGPVIHVKHSATTNGQGGIGGLESHLLACKNGQIYSLHDWGRYQDIVPTSIVIPEAPRGFVVTLKTDSKTENQRRGRQSSSIPQEAKTQKYQGDYIKIDWVYPHPDIFGFGISQKYFFAVERVAKKFGYPSIHVDATHNGLSYWAKKEFDLKISEEYHDSLVQGYQQFKDDPKDYIHKISKLSPFLSDEHHGSLPDKINPNRPNTIPRIFMNVLGAIYMMNGAHLHFYKKFPAIDKIEH